MESSAKSKQNRVSASKVRLVTNEIKGYSLPEAIDILKNMPQKGARIVLKTLSKTACPVIVPLYPERIVGDADMAGICAAGSYDPEVSRIEDLPAFQA